MVLVLRSHVKLLGGEQCFCWIMLLLLCSNVVLIWYRCINLLWPHRYWNMLAKEMCGKSYPGLLRLLQWSKRNQFPERSPLTREQPHCLDRQNWWYGKNIPTIWVSRKNKNPNCKCQWSKVWSDSVFFPQSPLFQFSSSVKNSKNRRLHHRRNSFVQTVYWHSKQTYTRDKVILSENSDTVFFPVISLPTIKAVSTFRHSACYNCNLQRMAAGPRMAGLVLHPDYAWAVGYEGKPPDEWLWKVKKWNMSLWFNVQ